MSRNRMLAMSTLALVVMLAIGFLCRPPGAHAGMSPVQALSLSVGAQGRWLDTPHLNAEPDFELAGNASMILTPHIDLTGGVALGLGGSYLREQVDGRYTIAEDGTGFSLWLGGGYYWSEEFDDGLKGWAAKAGFGWQPSERAPIILGMTGATTPGDGRGSLSLSATYLAKRGGE